MIDPMVDLRPMADFVELGWLHALNRQVANPVGVHVGLWVDDDPRPDGTTGDGRTALGWTVVPLAAADLVLAQSDLIVARQVAFRTHIDDILGGTR